MNYKEIFNGLKWASFELAFDSILKLALKLLLAKLLLPKDFGLIGMCLIFIGVTQAFSQLGMSAALIQKKENKEAEAMYSTAFWSNLCLAVVLYLILSFLVAPLVAKFYEEPILITILPYLGLPILIAPFSLVPSTILTRKLNFKVLTKIFSVTATIAGLTAVLMAYFGFGVWSLVANQVLNVALSVPPLLYVTKWRPKLEWNKSHFKNIFHFGIYSTGTSLTRSLMTNLDKLIIGKVLGTALLGVYTLAITLTDYLTNYLIRITNKVIYPVYSNYQDNNEKLKLFLLTIMKVNALLVYPFMAILVNFGDYIILNFFGVEWAGAITPLKYIALAMMVNILANGFDAVLRAKGKPSMEFKIIALVNLFVLVPCLYLGVTKFGIVGAAFAIIINAVVLVFIAITVLDKQIGLKPKEPFLAIKGAILGVFVATGLVELVSIWLSDPFIYLKISIFILGYIIVAGLMEYKLFKRILVAVK